MSSSSPSTALPYPHQVGGHGLLAVTPTGNVIKPSSLKELNFYNYINSPELPISLRWIRLVTPFYHGQADKFPELPSNNATANPSELTWLTTDATGKCFSSISPWAARMGSRRKNLSSRDVQKRPRPCIELEDINSAFVIPCVMDCKIGTRHYDDDASEAKRQRHIWKARSTTSARCGVRYTGMQAFKREKGALDGGFSSGGLEHRDKYLGRRLTELDLVPWATWFFHDGFRVRRECVRLILDKIMKLRGMLNDQREWYFYSSSLLLVYEGALDDIAPVKVDVRMIDFAHTVMSNGCRDDGYVLGIDYLIKILTEILENEDKEETRLPRKGGLGGMSGIGAGTDIGNPVGSDMASAFENDFKSDVACGVEGLKGELSGVNGMGKHGAEEHGVEENGVGVDVCEQLVNQSVEDSGTITKSAAETSSSVIATAALQHVRPVIEMKIAKG